MVSFKFGLVGMIGLGLLALPLVADDGGKSGGNRDSKGSKPEDKPPVAAVPAQPPANPPTQPPEDVAKPETGDSGSADKQPEWAKQANWGQIKRPDRKDGEERPVADDVKKLLDQFEQAREQHLKEQLDLAKQLKNATERQRDQVREQLKENRREWQAQQKLLSQQIRERLNEIKDELKEHNKKVREELGHDGGGNRGR
jgi:gas vesicle protein